MAVMTRSDEQIQQDVLRELTFDATVQPNEIGVSVKDGVVTLTGWVDTFLKKWSAEEAAHRVNGVRAVANDIKVKLPTSSERTDAEIAEAVSRALAWDVAVPADRIQLTVSKGWVTLKGEVDWGFQSSDAERVVRRIKGVKGISNLLVVHPRAHPTPDEMRKRIEDALERMAETDARRIHVEVKGDKAILTGTVRSYAEKEEAERAAWSAPGIASVDDRISISL